MFVFGTGESPRHKPAGLGADPQQMSSPRACSSWLKQNKLPFSPLLSLSTQRDAGGLPALPFLLGFSAIWFPCRLPHVCNTRGSRWVIHCLSCSLRTFPGHKPLLVRILPIFLEILWAATTPNMKHLVPKHFFLLRVLVETVFSPSTHNLVSTSSPLRILRTHQQIASTLHPDFKNRAVQGLTNLNV